MSNEKLVRDLERVLEYITDHCHKLMPKERCSKAIPFLLRLMIYAVRMNQIRDDGKA